MLTLHDVLGRKVVDIVVEIFVSCCLLEGEVLGLDEAVQEVVLLAVLLLPLPALDPALLLLPAHNNSQDIEPQVDIKDVMTVRGARYLAAPWPVSMAAPLLLLRLNSRLTLSWGGSASSSSAPAGDLALTGVELGEFPDIKIVTFKK